MSIYSDLLKGLLVKKEGTLANKKAKKAQGKAIQELSKAFKQGQAQVTATPVVKSTARGT